MTKDAVRQDQPYGSWNSLGITVPPAIWIYSVKAYPRETVVAEKFQAMVMLGIAISRMKDFYDLWTLTRQFEFSGPQLSAAIQATFNRRQTALPERLPLALTTEFTEDRQKLTQWQAFVSKGKLDVEAMTLQAIAHSLREFLMPPTQALVDGVNFEMTWLTNGPWIPSKEP